MNAKQKLTKYLAQINITDAARVDKAWELVEAAASEKDQDYPSIRNNFAAHHHEAIIQIAESLIEAKKETTPKSKSQTKVNPEPKTTEDPVEVANSEKE